jgi:transcriptional regulator with XRE-family HTH domain
MDIPALPICQTTLKAQKPPKKAYPNSLVTIGDHMLKKRVELRLLQKDVAKLLSVDECTVTNWEKNHSQPKLHYLPKIIQFLGYIPFEIEGTSQGERIKLYRKIRGISQKKLAREIGVDPCTLARWERNKCRAKIHFLNIISQFFIH